MGRRTRENVSWTKKLVRQVVQRILDTVLWPSPVIAHWMAYWRNICQTWELSAFSVPWETMVMRCAPKITVKLMTMKGPYQLKTDTCHLPLQRSNHGHCSCWPLTPLKGVQGGDKKTKCSGKNCKTVLQIDIFRKRFYESKSLQLLIPRKTLTLLIIVLLWLLRRISQLKIKIK